MTLSRKSWPPGSILAIFIRLILALACIALAFWGTRFCRDVVASTAAPGADPDLNRLAAVVSWIVIFGPFALLGLYALVRACTTCYRTLAARRLHEAVRILPPLPGNAMPAGGASTARFRTHHFNEPLDDDSRRRLDRLAARAAKAIGITIGMFFVGLGLAGFFLAWMQGHQPPARGEVTSFGFALRFLVVCGVSVLVGAVILRETFAQPKTGWLAPLRVLTVIASRKLNEEERERRNDR